MARVFLDQKTWLDPAMTPVEVDLTRSITRVSQAIALDPVAHFKILKELGENGGGFFAINSAHPFENSNPATNLREIVAVRLWQWLAFSLHLSIPTACLPTTASRRG